MSTNSTTTNAAKPLRVNIDPRKIPAYLRNQKLWVGWKWMWNGKKWDKPPVNPKTGIKCSKTDPRSWRTFEDAMAAFAEGRIDGIGFCITVDSGLVVIDLDNCLDPESGMPNDWAQYLLEQFIDTHCEVSPSGHGIKIFVRGKLVAGRKENENKGIELFGPGSYVCVTGRACPGCGDDVAETQDRIDYLQQYVVQEKTRSWRTAPLTDQELATEALKGLASWRCEDYKSWIRVGQALHSVDRSLLNTWDTWSRGSEKYQDGVCAAKWETFSANGHGLGIGSLIYWAKEDGWIPPQREQHANGSSNPYTNGQAKPESPPSPEPFIRKSVSALELNPPTMRPPLLDPGLRRGEIANVISVSKVGKSWLAYSLSYSLAQELMWLDRFATKRSRVLLLDNELHESTLECRLVKVAEAMGIKLADCKSHFDYLILRGKARRNLFELRSELEKLTGAYDVVILDALYRMLPEDANENDNAQMTQLYNELDRLAAMLGAAFVCIHHSSKGSQSDKRVTDVGAGAGAQSRAADSHFILREHEEKDHVVMDAALRSFAPIDPLGLRWEWPLWRPCDEIDVEQLKGKKSHGDERQDAKDQEADGAIIDQCQTWRSRSELQRTTGMNPNRINRAIARLLKLNYLEQSDEERPGVKKGTKVEVFRKTIYAR